jgi:FAD/FMN-containing dehydrogenase
MTQVHVLTNSMRGAVLTEGDALYDETRQIWNGMFDRSPGVIARCTGAADVIAAVKYAAAENLLVAVRGGGHSFPATPSVMAAS